MALECSPLQSSFAMLLAWLARHNRHALFLDPAVLQDDQSCSFVSHRADPAEAIRLHLNFFGSPMLLSLPSLASVGSSSQPLLFASPIVVDFVLAESRRLRRALQRR